MAILKQEATRTIPKSAESLGLENNERGESKQTGKQNDNNGFGDNKNNNNKSQYANLKYVWVNVIAFAVLHALLFPAIYVILFVRPWKTMIWTFINMICVGLGVTGGMHRLWSHRSFKVRLPLKLFIMYFATMLGQNSILVWSRDHRVHHKYSETDADPHNINRGFFFAHMGWLLTQKLPIVKEKSKQIDLSDLKADWMIMFQYKYFYYLFTLIGIVIPVSVPVLVWGESLWNSFLVCFVFRYLFINHITWLVNSAAHTYGSRPYDKNMQARDNTWQGTIMFGEQFHNYHHAFPYDYRVSEFGEKANITTFFINLWAKLNLAYDLKTASQSIIEQRKLRTGEQLPMSN